MELKEYMVGDIIAIKTTDVKAISCMVINIGEAMAKDGKVLRFNPDQVLWKLGKNGRWPGWVHKMFRGEAVGNDKSRNETR